MTSMALEGIRVLDCTRLLAGPYCALLLADMGAEVIKIERPAIGEDYRSAPPFFKGVSVGFITHNRNKKGITLNLKSEKGKEIFKDLIRVSDIVVENNRAGTMERLGLGYEALSRANPAIILTSISGFGQYGPYKDRAGLDIVAQAMGGLMSFSGYPDRPPTKAGNALGDFLASLYAVYGTLAALYYREKTGLGQWIDAGMMESVAATCGLSLPKYTILGMVEERTGNWLPTHAPWNSYQAKDGYCIVGVANDSLWARCAKAIGREELAEDPRFSTVAQRVKNHLLVDEILEGWMREKSVKEAEVALVEAGVPCSPILSMDELVADPHFLAREMVVEVVHPRAGKIRICGVTPKLSRTPGKVRIPAPMLGQHNREVYCELLGYDKEDLLRWEEDGVI